ncbi:TrpR family trp operon transcriptional repressor [Elusimicrobium simillimum]|uniref:Trp family transcriptional regulator n=1 Tax=Elusimicrobium simillimum TaxID=3143438 RepID=UPI003C6FDFE4
MTQKTNKTQIGALEDFAASLLKLKTEKEITTFLKEILTPNELKTLSLRWRLLQMLDEGYTQRGIAKELSVSLCKITRGAKLLNKQSTTKKILK